jgi:hypothetical protein
VQGTVITIDGALVYDTPNTKGSHRRVPLTAATTELLRDYLARHPRRDDPSAPLFCRDVASSQADGTQGYAGTAHRRRGAGGDVTRRCCRAIGAGLIGAAATPDLLQGRCRHVGRLDDQMRPRDLNTANFPFLRGYGLQNYVTDEVFLGRLAKSPKEDRRTAALEWMKVFGNSLRWEDLGWLRSLTRRDRQVREQCTTCFCT